MSTREDGGSLWGAQMSVDGGVSWQALCDDIIIATLKTELIANNTIPAGRNLSLTFADVKDGIIFLQGILLADNLFHNNDNLKEYVISNAFAVLRLQII